MASRNSLRVIPNRRSRRIRKLGRNADQIILVCSANEGRLMGSQIKIQSQAIDVVVSRSVGIKAKAAGVCAITGGRVVSHILIRRCLQGGERGGTHAGSYT